MLCLYDFVSCFLFIFQNESKNISILQIIYKHIFIWLNKIY